MVGEVIQSYLVSLGVEIDQPGFSQMQKTLNQTSQAVASAAGGWAKQFATAAGIIGAAIAGVTTATAGLMASAAKQDLAVEKYARSMLVGKDAAMEMKLAVDALGESIENIQLTPELMGRYGALVADGRKMKVGGDYASQMKGLRDLLFEFARLKQEAAYAMQWVGYYLTKYLAQPLAKAKSAFREINSNLIKSMPVWTEKIARGLAHVVDIGLSFLRLLKNVGKGLYEIWDSFPRGTKLAIASLGALFAFVNASPIGKFVALLGTMLLLVEDYFGYMDGKNAALGPIWDRLNRAMDTAKEKLKAWGSLIVPVWDSFTDGLAAAKKQLVSWSELLAPVWKGFEKHLQSAEGNVKTLGKSLYGLGKEALGFASSALEEFQKSLQRHEVAEKFSDVLDRLRRNFEDLTRWTGKCIDAVSAWLRQLRDDEAVREFMDAVAELCGAILELFAALNDLVTVALSAFFGEMDKTDRVYTFRDAVKSVVELITEMIRCISRVIESLTDLFKMMSDNKQFVEFWKGLSNAAQGFSNIVAGALDNVGKLGKKMLQLAREKYDKVSKAVGSALFSTAEASGSKEDYIPTGIISALGESGNPEGDPGAYGNDSTGGPSYGAYQIAQRTIPEFLKFLELHNAEYAERLSAIKVVDDGDFLTEWRSIVKEDPKEFLRLQRQYIRESHYNEQVDNLKNMGIDIKNRSNTFKEVLFSMAVQLRNYTPRVFERALEGKSIDDFTDEELIPKLYEIRKDYFWGSTPEERKSVWNRLDKELPYAMESLKIERQEEQNKVEDKPDKQQENNDSQYEFKNPSDGLREPTWIDEKIDQIKNWEGWGYIKEIFSETEEKVSNVDPFLHQNLVAGSSLNDIEGPSVNITYQVDVGGVKVENTNASASDIGDSVADKTLNGLTANTNYLYFSRAITGVLG